MSLSPTLRAFQDAGAEFLTRRPRAAIFDTMGLGKTPQAIDAIKGLHANNPADADRVLVIAPLATALGWQRELDRWWPAHAPFTICRRKTPLPASGIVFVPWTDLSVRLPELLKAAWDVVIGDEIHRIKGGTAVKMSRAFTGAWEKDGGAWARLPGIVDQAKRVWMLTGTPMPNSRPIELLAPLLALGAVGNVRDGACISRKDFENTFCRQENRWTPQGFDLLGRRNINDLADLMRASGVILRRTPADVPGELPALQRVIVPLGGVKDCATKAQLEYVQRGEIPPLTEMSAYRRDLGAAKAEAAIPWIISHLEDEDAMVVFVHHKAVG